jgi:hypothetical protein
LNQLIQTKEVKETHLQAKKRQVQADKLKKEVETAAIIKER